MSSTPLTLGTAGHVDHGKTRLVEALTGTDTDRLPEEKRRGISIALGYARLELPGGRRLSVVDVPGHERFVRTMVAGATGIDLYLLVVDAGEGPRAQTYEHLDILRLLGIDRGVVALTKVDAVGPERVAATADAVSALIPEAESVAVSALAGTGLDALRAALARAADEVDGRRGGGDPTRLHVDRSFSLPGAGPVVTGTLRSGTLGAGDRLEVLPAGFAVRVRSVEVHGEAAERAGAGQRVAVAFTAERRRRPRAGDALVEPGAYTPSYRLDVALERADAVGAGPVTVCHGTSAVAGRVVRVGAHHAQLRLSRPLVAARGDRVVLRRETTLGGGRVLDPRPPRRIDARRLELLERDDPVSLASALVDAPVARAELRRRLEAAELERVARLDAVVAAGEWLCSRSWLERTRARAHAALEARAGELDPGLPASSLLGAEPWAPAVAELLGLEPERGRLYLPGSRPTASGHDGGIDARLAAAGLDPVALADPELARQLEAEGRVVRLGDRLVIAPAAYRAFRAALIEEWEHAGSVSLAGFRDRAGVSRRVAQLLLERFDADRLTLRVGDERRLRRSARTG